MVDLAMNAVSTILGIILIPLSGILWEIFPGMIIYPLFHLGTFNPITWAATFVLAALTNALVESLVIRYGFKIQVSKKRFWILAAANLVSVGLAMASLFVSPPPDF